MLPSEPILFLGLPLYLSEWCPVCSPLCAFWSEGRIISWGATATVFAELAEILPKYVHPEIPGSLQENSQ
jgi:hypothetical protein